MTPHQRWLLSAAKEAQDYFDRRVQGRPSRGPYELIGLGRTLAAAIRAVEDDERTDKETAA